jgi:hypothetical protein
MRRLRVVSSLLIVLCAGAGPARAGCIGVPVEVHLASDSVAAVFRGRILDLRLIEHPALPGRSGQGQIARFDVDRVWKGDVGAQVVLHFRPVDGPRLVPDGEYVVFAHRLDAFGRYQFNLPVDPVVR